MPNSSNKRPKRPQQRSTNNKYNTNKKTRTNKNIKGKKKKGMNPKLKLALKIIIITFLLLCVIGAGIIAAIFFGLFGDEFEITKEELVVGSSNTIILDKDGNEIANLSTDEKRKTISLSEMSEYLPKAYIAIEDKRFYSHNGIDIKRTTGAILGTVTGNSSYGGSSITQQLVKNITKDDARSGVAGITRKVKEWAKAVQVERMISKDQILELYLNIIFVGGNNLHGVELGSVYYFNKSAKDLDLAECAFLAGINNSPSKYNPFDESNDNKELIKNRTLTVLSQMKEQGLVTDETVYNEAENKVKNGLTFTKGDTSTNSTYSYHTDAAIKQVVEQVMEEKNISKALAENYVYGSGLTIYSTEDASIQAKVEEEFSKTNYIIAGKDKDQNGNLLNDHTQAALVIMDHTTGQVVAVGGELGNKYATGWNRGTQMVRQTGSSIKPIVDVAPALEEKVITAATVYDDVKTLFDGVYKPDDYNTPKGLINIRSCIKTSQNIPMVKIMKELTPAKAIEYMKKMGVTSLDEENDNGLPLSIGGLTTGISPLEMAGAYATIANDGVYMTPIFYTKVVDSNGNTVLTPKQEKTRVFSEQNAYITREITAEPVKSGGTATYCAIPGMETCAKTGSTDEYYDRWLCGMTPYYTAACWFGYDNNERVTASGNPAGNIWAAVMKSVHKDLPNKNFNKPSGIVTATVCRTTGCIAVSSCTDTYSEIFTQDNMPEKCEGHGVQSICQESGKIANEYCPAEQVKKISYGGVVPKEKLNLWKPLGAASSTSKAKVEETCTNHKKPEEKPEITNNTVDTNTITTNTTDKTNTTSTNTTNTTPQNTTNKNNTSTEKTSTGNGTKQH
ncbi:MAG: penicillin-binding protein [Clostridia bacterium]|nr:penicillin-binding protein [Clostridia bacterium]